MFYKIIKRGREIINKVIRLQKVTMVGKEVKMGVRKMGARKREVKRRVLKKAIKVKRGNSRVKSKQKMVEFELVAPTANKVILTGDFNSWSIEGIEMKKNSKGTWKTKVSLGPGRYEYKFIVDGEWWNDPANSNMVPNIYGGVNSVKEVGV